MKTYVNENGYVCVRLHDRNGKGKIWKVHRLMMLSFIGPNPNKPIVNHKNGDKLKNVLSNLEWSTSSENNKHAYDTGLKTTDSFSKEYHITIDDTEFTVKTAKKAAKKLHELGYFKDVKVENLTAGIHSSASKHQLYLGVLKAEFTNDPYDVPKKYHTCGLKGRSICIRLDFGVIMQAKGPTKLAKKLHENEYMLDLTIDQLKRKLGSTAQKEGQFRGYYVWYK